MSYVMKETHTGLMQPAKKNCPRELKARRTVVECSKCGYTTKMSELGLRKIPESWVCKSCRDKGQREINKVIIEMYNRRKKR